MTEESDEQRKASENVSKSDEPKTKYKAEKAGYFRGHNYREGQEAELTAEEAEASAEQAKTDPAAATFVASSDAPDLEDTKQPQ